MFLDIRKEENVSLLNDLIRSAKSRGLKVVAVSGFFDPIHGGHIEYLKRAKFLGETETLLVVILNTDEQAIVKKGSSFMDELDRVAVLDSIRFVDIVITSIDKDSTVCGTLEILRPDVFAKGGDRFVSEIPESDICHKLNISMIDRLGEKIQSSSDIIERAKKIR